MEQPPQARTPDPFQASDSSPVSQAAQAAPRGSSAPPGPPAPDGDIFDLGLPAPRRASADVFELEPPVAPVTPSRAVAAPDDPFADLLAPAPAAPAATAVAEALPAEPAEEPEPEDVLFPGLASRDSRRRYLDNLGSEGIFLLDLTPAEPPPAPAAFEPEPPVTAVFEEPWIPEEPAAAGSEIAQVVEETVEAAEPEPVWAEPEPIPVPIEDEPTESWSPVQPVQELQPEPAPVFDFEEPAPWTPEPEPELAVPAAGPVATATLGDLYLSQGHLGEAERIFHEVLRREPDSADARVGLERLAARRAERRPLSGRDLLAGYEPGEEGGEAERRARKAWVLTEYLRRLRGGDQHDVS